MKLKNKYKRNQMICVVVGLNLFAPLGAQNRELIEKPKKEIEQKESVEFYEDSETGQIFTKPGPKRTKIKTFPTAKKEKIEPLSSNFVKRPAEIQNEKFTLNGLLQIHGISGQTQSAYNNGHRDFNSMDWSIRRARIGFLYQGAKWWGATLTLRLENAFASPYLAQGNTTAVCADATCSTKVSALTSQPSLKDSRGFIQGAFVYVNLPLYFKLSAGMLPVQFNREHLMSSANFISIERAFVTSALPMFDNGFTIQWSPLGEIIDKKYEKYLVLTWMVSNGHGAGNYGFGRRSDLTYSKSGTAPIIISPFYSGRIQYNVFGGLMSDSGKDTGWHEGEEIFQSEMKWSIGTGIAQTKNYKVIGTSYPTEFQQRNMEVFQLTSYQATGDGGNPPTSATSSGLINSSLDFTSQNTKSGLNLARANMGLVAHNYDTTFTYRHIYLNGVMSYFSGAASNNIRSHHVTVGYNIPFLGKWIMPVVRYEFFKSDFNRDGTYSSNETFKLYWIGFNFFGDKHLLKAQVFFNVFKDDLGVNAYGQGYDLNNNQFYFQLQGAFWTGVTPPDQLEMRLGN